MRMARDTHRRILSVPTLSLGQLERGRMQVLLLSKLPVRLPRLIRALREVEVIGIEISKALEPLDIRDRDGVPF
jgi:hypothetical protein